MKLSENWLREWVNPAVDSARLCEQLTMLGLEVDSVEKVASDFSGVVVGEVVECSRHPDADKLQITKVNVGGERLLDIVCGAKNCRQGLKVACAVDGALLPNDFKIKKTKLRGQPSEGMLCSFSELGIAIDADGIIELPVDAPVGKDLRAYLDLDDNSIDISLTPNRADCLSVMGIARDIAVLNRLSLPTLNITPTEVDILDQVAVDVQISEACPRYLARMLKNINLQAKTPLWMQEKLRRGGIRTIDPVVDVTNYILLAYGQPMHAFDANKVTQPIQVRMATEGETLTLLDGNSVNLQANTLVIADQTGPIALAGIFGGEKTAVTAETQNIILEAAFFAPLAITGRARQYGLHTESSHRFERGVDFAFTAQMMELATQLILDICGGEAGAITEVKNEKNFPNLRALKLTRTKLDRLLGHHIPTETVTDILSRLGFTVNFANNEWQVTPTSWRFDIQIEEDLLEEVARIYGYNSIPNHAPLAHLQIHAKPEKDFDLNRLRQAFVDADYQEIISYSFVDPDIQNQLHPHQEALILPNPISKEMSAMRLSLLSGLLNTLIYNQNRQQNRVRLFETGLCFIPDIKAENGVRQEMMISALICGDRLPISWAQKNITADFFDLKGDLEHILALTKVGNRLQFIAKSFNALHPGQSAAILLDEEEIGFIGTLHPKIAQILGITGKPIVAEIKWSAINEQNVPNAKEISRFPANKRDLALVVDEAVPAQAILNACYEAGGKQLINANLFDVYQGSNLGAGKKSLAVSLTIQDTQKTLEEKDINAVVSAVINVLASHFNAYLRE